MAKPKRDPRNAADYVPHPRYGAQRRFTGLDTDDIIEASGPDGYVMFHWHSPLEVRIPNTAVRADVARQIFTTMPVTHFFDTKVVCKSCRQPFIVFADEQKHWYEELGFSIEAWCDRCVPCRKRQQGIARRRERYEALCHVTSRSPAENFEMAECMLALVEASIFHRRQLERVRMLAKHVPEAARSDLLRRVARLEGGEKTPHKAE